MSWVLAFALEQVLSRKVAAARVLMDLDRLSFFLSVSSCNLRLTH